MQLMVFSKHLAGPSLSETGQKLKAMGIDAIDLTVRPGGHVEPAKVRDELPRAVEELGTQGVRVGMMTTNILDASDAETQAILETASSLGIQYYKIGYYLYNEFGSLRRQREEVGARLRDLAKLNRDLGVRGGYHNHSHNFFGANLGDIAHVLDSIDSTAVGVYLDPAHATIEGGSSGWLMGLDLVIDRVIMLAVKDYRWVENGGYAGGRRFGVQWCPLIDGNSPWPRVLELLQKSGFDGPTSLHSEYQGSHSYEDLTTEQVFEQTARDAEVFRGWLKESAA